MRVNAGDELKGVDLKYAISIIMGTHICCLGVIRDDSRLVWLCAVKLQYCNYYYYYYSGLSLRFEVGGEIVKVDGTGGRRPLHRRGIWGRLGPQWGTGAEPRWGSRGRSPQKRNEFDLLTFTKIAFPQRNFNKSHFLKRTLRY